MRPSSIFAIAAAVGLVGCSAPFNLDDISSNPAPIVGGQPTAPCAFPTTIAFRAENAGCTATLVHPKLITVAKHCLEGETPVEVLFGDTDNNPSQAPRRVKIASCKVADDDDFAYCVLAQEVNDVPIVPILFGCERAQIKVGAKVVLVGFGFIDANTAPPGGHKRWVELDVDKVEQRSIIVGDVQHGACFGDSGGPAYIKLPDGTWRVWGVTNSSAGQGSACAAMSAYAYTPYFVPWIEQNSGLDVTPCYDADGTWNPGPKCTGFPTNTEVSGGTWAKMCTENLILSGPSAACGGATDAGPSVPDSSGTGAGGRADAGTPTGTGAGGNAGRGGATGAGAGGASSSGTGGSAGTGGAMGTGGGGGSTGTGGMSTTAGSSTVTSGTTSGAGGSTGGSRSRPTASGNAEGGCSCRVGVGAASDRFRALFAIALAAWIGRRRKAPPTSRPHAAPIRGEAPPSGRCA